MRTTRQKRNSAIGITGTPGTGKKTVAPLVSQALKFPLLDLNAFAVEHGCAEESRNGTTVDVGKLRRALGKGKPNNLVIFGHLLPEVFRRGEIDFVAVLRCDPLILKERLLARGYRHAHLIENLEAELIGVLLSNSLKVFGKAGLREYDSTKAHPAQISRQIVRDFGTNPQGRRSWIDWTTSYDSPAKLRSLLSNESKDSALT